MDENGLVTIEELAQRATCTWRTAKKRLVAHGIRPVSATKKSELYDYATAMQAVVYGDDDRTLTAHRHFTDGVTKFVMPALFNSDAPMLRYIVGLLREKGLSKGAALQEAGTILVMALESLKTNMLIADPKTEIDWLMDAAKQFPDLIGLELFEKYAAAHWPD